MRHDEAVATSISLLARMVSIPSLSGEESAVADLVSEHLTVLHPTEMRRIGHSVIAIWKGVEPGPTLLLCSHIDTVAPASGWTKDPFSPTFENGRLYGLGANDAGASVVSMVGAVASMLPLQRGTVILCLAAEEELGSNGFMAIEPQLPRYDAAIFGEPTEMGAASEMRGAMRLLMRSRGVAAHASRPWEGQNAIESFISDMAKIRGIPVNDDSPWGGATIEPTIIQGGSSANQLPDCITTTLDIRTTFSRPNAWILERLWQSGIEHEVLANRRNPMRNEQNHPLMRAILECSSKIPPYVFNGTCDMAFSKAPSVVLGPGHSARSHTANEYVELREIAEAIKVYSSVIDTYLGAPSLRDYAAA
jgi:acetylornithine deacetylase